jgi:hypothetical protein
VSTGCSGCQGRSYEILSGYGIFSTCIYNITAIMFGTSRYEAQFLDDANEARCACIT